jgi:hypothetical protein
MAIKMSDLPGYPLRRVAVTLVTGEERFNKCKGEPSPEASWVRFLYR